MTIQSTAPKLAELKERPCTVEELQAALVTLIEHHNGLLSILNRMVANGQIRSRQEALMNQPYNL